MPQQTLRTERITLVPLADEHLEWEVELDSDPEVMRYLSGRVSAREEVETSHARRIASEGARELVRYGFDDVGLDRIIAETLTVNAGSRAVMERVGLVYVRTFPTTMTDVAGIEEGEVEYEMTRAEWERRTT